MFKATKLDSQSLDNLRQGHRSAFFEVPYSAISSWRMRFGGRGARNGNRRGVFMGSGNDVGEPGVEALGSSIHGRVRAVDGNASLGQLQECSLLGIAIRNGLEAGEDKGIWIRDTRAKLVARHRIETGQ